MTMTWVERLNESREDAVLNEIQSYVDGTADANILAMDENEYFELQRNKLHNADKTSVLIIMGLFGVSLVVLFVNHFSIKKWEKKATEERDEARIVAYTDPLTGVKSKNAFVIEEKRLETSIADGDTSEFGVIVCDVNGLKRINDTLGHKAGDEYIKNACKLLCEYFKHSPVFRIGGDEFVVLLEGHDYQMQNEILKDINTNIESNIGSNNVVASLGVANYDPDVDKSFYEVFKRADGLMYERKMQLKNMGAVTRD